MERRRTQHIDTDVRRDRWLLSAATSWLQRQSTFALPLPFGTGQPVPLPEARLAEHDFPRAGISWMADDFTRLLHTLRAKDYQLYRHSLRVHFLSSPLLPPLALPAEMVTSIELAALFHDIGKLYLPAELLHQARPLSAGEFARIKEHCLQGALLLSRLGAPREITHSVYHHHERWDGQGYPCGLAGPDIPLGARFIAIIDAFEVMTSGRAYQQPCSPLQAIEELYRHAGTQFDPALVEIFYLTLTSPAPFTPSANEP